MTLREFTPPVLDRIIKREATVEKTGAAVHSYTWNVEDRQQERPDDMSWYRESDTELRVALDATSGGDFPTDLTAPIEGVGVSWDGAEPVTLTVTAIEIIRLGFTFVPVGVRLTFDGDLPAAGMVLTLSIPTGEETTITTTVMRSEWAARRDFMGRDVVSASDTGLYSLTDSRFIVRAGGPGWDEGDNFTDDEGTTRTVRGVAQIGRGRYLELLARSVG